MRHVIIGAGPAGIAAAEHLRKLDKNAQITVIGDEPEPPYSRMAIPYYLIGNIPEQGTYLRKQQDWFKSLDIELQQQSVESVDPATKCLTLINKETIAFDKLLIATGSHPIRPPISGIDLPQVHTCWTLKDAREIAALAQEGAHIVLMGAGFIGCIVLEALALCKVDLTVVEMENRMVPRMMNDMTGGMIKQWCLNKGVKVLTSTKITEVKENKSYFWQKKPKTALSIALDSGETLQADMLISAAGVRSNFDFLQNSGIELKQGVMVNEYMQTNFADIYSAGDVAQGRDFSTGEYTVQAIQPTAVEHGKLAATNMIRGNTSSHSGSVNMNVLDTLGLISTSFGSWMGVEGGEYAEFCDKDAFKYINLQFDGDVLVGASSLGITQHVGVLRGLIQTRVHLGEWKGKLQRDPTRIMEAYLAMGQQQHQYYNA